MGQALPLTRHGAFGSFQGEHAASSLRKRDAHERQKWSLSGRMVRGAQEKRGAEDDGGEAKEKRSYPGARGRGAAACADRGFLGSVSIMSIPLWQRKAEKPCPPATVRAVRCQEARMLFGDYAETDPDCQPCFPIPAEYFTVPYGYFFALGVVLFFGGLGLLILGCMYEEKRGVS